MKENKILPDDSPELAEKKKLYAKLCADKKPYFFAYNYTSLKAEYDTFMKNAQSNAVSLYKKDLNTMLKEYENGLLIDENEIKFIDNFHHKLPLDMAKSTMNRICWQIEDEFDGINLFGDVKFDYSVLKSGNGYNEQDYKIVKHICDSYKPSVQLAKKHMFLNDGENDEDWKSVDVILKNLSENLYSHCPNENELCDILVDLCYGGNISKQVLWNTCGNVIIKHLLKSHDYKMSYPQKSDCGDFWCQGVLYKMREIIMKDGDYDETVQI